MSPCKYRRRCICGKLSGADAVAAVTTRTLCERQTAAFPHDSLKGYRIIVDLEGSVRIKYQMNYTFVVGCSKVKMGVHTQPITGVTKTCTYSFGSRKSISTPKGVRARFVKTRSSVDDDMPHSLSTLIQAFQAVRLEAYVRNTSLMSIYRYQTRCKDIANFYSWQRP